MPGLVDQVLARGNGATRFAQPDHVVFAAIAIGVGAAQVLAARVLGPGELHLRVVAPGEHRARVVEHQDDQAEAQRAGEGADQDRDLLPRRRGAHDVTRFQVLRGGAAV